MKDLSDLGAGEITLAAESVQECLYEKTGDDDDFELLDTRKGEYRMASESERIDVVGDCIRKKLPTMGEVAKEFFKEVLDRIDGRPPPD